MIVENPQQIQFVEECIKKVMNWGSDKFINICDGTSIIVEWGQVDWFLNVILYSIIGSLVIVLLICFYKLFTER